jgi:hypothetical protein
MVDGLKHIMALNESMGNRSQDGGIKETVARPMGRKNRTLPLLNVVIIWDIAST